MDQPEQTLSERAARARRRALRAAQVVTMSACLAGCSMSHGNVDSGAGTDAGPELTDAGPDTDCVTYEDAQDSRECCEQMYGTWMDDRCFLAVEGPRVPPPMTV